ncbi:hypothetical protein Dsin_027602 [Dipteronia sinensis]|uniref:IST1-like protein n=1 Tax=Dipteronia sinensis TaxID=43782 RepID=A0AAD9ZQH5_9ROSI|nr:hypothetical protein Dsin_027602 [Dipteronia sinensis]
MFDIFFGWRKASKCKNLVRHVQCRLKFLKIKRDSIVMQLRDEIAQLLENGHNDIAFSRVEQLFQDQSLLAAYDLLQHYCEFIIIHLPYIRKHKDCPNDINEAVSTLIFAAAWCGDLPELQKIQKLFGERYGPKFAKAAVELCPGTLVNSQIRENLCKKTIPENVKSRLMYEIAKDYNLPQELLGCDDNRLSEPHLPKLCGNGTDCQWEGFIFEEETALVNYNSLGGVLIGRSCNSNPAKLILEPLQVTAMHTSTLQVENCAAVKHLCKPTTIHQRRSFESCSSKKLSIVSLESKAEPGSISAYQLHRSIVNFQEVEKIQFNTLQDQSREEDKRTFLFNLSNFPLANQSCLSQAILQEKNVRSGKYYEETFDFSQDRKKFICHQSGHCNKHHLSQMHICCKHNHRKSFCRFSQEMDLNCSLEQPCYYYTTVLEFDNDIQVKKCRNLGKEVRVSDLLGSFAPCSRGSSNPDIVEPKPSKRSTNSSHTHSHVHPKLPDYDELAAKFKALKKEHQQRIAKGNHMQD